MALVCVASSDGNYHTPALYCGTFLVKRVVAATTVAVSSLLDARGSGHGDGPAAKVAAAAIVRVASACVQAKVS
eukprot:4834124-Pleurochrysis_carterae.AAC.1